MWMPLDYAYPVPSPNAPHCCEAMTAALAFDCEQHADPFACNDALIIYHEPFNEYGIVIHDGGPSYVLIRHCPWCGTSLPESQRDRWFNALEANGIDDFDAGNLPPEYLSSAWRTGSQRSKET